MLSPPFKLSVGHNADFQEMLKEEKKMVMVGRKRRRTKKGISELLDNRIVLWGQNMEAKRTLYHLPAGCL